MRKLSADYLYCEGETFIENGILVVDDQGKILQIINPKNEPEALLDAGLEKHKGIICPGFVNTHCHTELSVYRGLIPQKQGLDGFIRELEKAKKADFTPKQINQAIEEANIEMEKNGIVAVGDICNTAQSIEAKKSSALYYQNFVEIFGSNETLAAPLFGKAEHLSAEFRKAQLQVALTPHSLYALSEPLLASIAADQSLHQTMLSLHFMESAEELEFFLFRQGSILSRAQSFGVTPHQYSAFRVRPSEIATRMLNKNLPILFVHNTFAEATDIHHLITEFQQIYFCLCPNANLYIEDKLPNVNLLIDSEAKITIGTDSLASNAELSILKELKTLHQAFPKTSTATLLQWATQNGAQFLGISNRYGTFELGKQPGINLIACENGILDTNSSVKPLFA